MGHVTAFCIIIYWVTWLRFVLLSNGSRDCVLCYCLMGHVTAFCIIMQFHNI